jgi:hypothetical protein
MRKYFFLITGLFLFYSFIQEIETTVFENPKKTLSIELAGNWTAAANMKGIDILIDAPSTVEDAPNKIAISSVDGLKEETTLEVFSGRKISLQTTVLNAKIEETGELTLAGNPAKYFVYSYKNDELVTLKTKVVFAVINKIGYQLTYTASTKDYAHNLPLFNQAVNSFKLL